MTQKSFVNTSSVDEFTCTIFMMCTYISDRFFFAVRGGRCQTSKVRNKITWFLITRYTCFKIVWFLFLKIFMKRTRAVCLYDSSRRTRATGSETSYSVSCRTHAKPVWPIRRIRCSGDGKCTTAREKKDPSITGTWTIVTISKHLHFDGDDFSPARVINIIPLRTIDNAFLIFFFFSLVSFRIIKHVLVGADVR